jgi:hypothetical protein
MKNEPMAVLSLKCLGGIPVSSARDGEEIMR